MKQEEIQTSFNAKFRMKITSIKDAKLRMKVTAIESAQFYKAGIEIQDMKDALEEIGIYAPTIKRIGIMHKVCEKNPPVLYELEGYYYQDAMWTQDSYEEDGEGYTETNVEIPTKYDGMTSIEFKGLRIELEFIEFEKNDETEGCAPF